MADSALSKILTVGMVGVAAYFIYEWLFPATTAASTTSTTGSTGTTTTGSTTGTTTTGSSATGSATSTSTLTTLAGIYTAFAAKMASVSDPAVTTVNGVLTATNDVFNYYLAEVLSQPAGYTGVDWPPNTSTVFGACCITMPITTYWAGISAYLTSTAGLHGLGSYGLGNYMHADGYGMWPEIAGPNFFGTGRAVQ